MSDQEHSPFTAPNGSPLPPHDVTSEQGALACVLQCPDDQPRAKELLAQLDSEHFYDSRHRSIVHALKALAHAEKPIELVALSLWCRDHKTTEACGGYVYISTLPDLAPSALNFDTYFEDLEQFRVKRAAIRDSATLESVARDPRVRGEQISHAAKSLLEAHSTNGAAKTFTIWKPSQFFSYNEPPGLDLLLPKYLSRGAITAFVGQGGTGKSRLSLYLAACQILKREWCGIPTSGPEGKWLLLGDENSVSRWKEDLGRMMGSWNEAEIALIENNLRMMACVEDSDNVWLGDHANVDRLNGTLASDKWLAVVFDPISNFAPEELSKPGPMRDVVRIIQTSMRRHAHESACLVLHHARTGRANIAQGVGFDAPNFSSGGKALFSAARCQINLMPASEDDESKLVLSCAKANNCTKFKARGLAYSHDTGAYTVDEAFNLEGWHAMITGTKQKTDLTPKMIADIVGEMGRQSGSPKKTAIVSELRAQFKVGKSAAYDAIERAARLKAIVFSETTKTYTAGAV